jgi:20S proteasome alpha/beta subunit
MGIGIAGLTSDARVLRYKFNSFIVIIKEKQDTNMTFITVTLCVQKL